MIPEDEKHGTTLMERMDQDQRDMAAENDLLLFYLVTSISLFSALIPTIVSLLLNLLIWDSPVETSLKRQVSDLKEELGSINMTDEFAKYSKIQRKLLKITDELKNKNNRQFVYQTKTRMILYALLYFLTTVTFFTINWNHYRKPVLYFTSENHDTDQLFYPIGSLLAFPTGQTNCLSITSWFFISGYVFRMLVKNFT